MTNIFNTIRYQYKRIHFLEVHTVLLIAAAIKIGWSNKYQAKRANKSPLSQIKEPTPLIILDINTNVYTF